MRRNSRKTLWPRLPTWRCYAYCVAFNFTQRQDNRPRPQPIRSSPHVLSPKNSLNFAQASIANMRGVWNRVKRSDEDVPYEAIPRGAQNSMIWWELRQWAGDNPRISGLLFVR